MRHRIKKSKLGRRSEHRKSLFMNLIKEVIQHRQIVTTLAKAKAVRPELETVISKALVADNALHKKRELFSYFMNDKTFVNKIIGVAKENFIGRPGGYSRIVKAGFRKGDSAPMAVFQLCEPLVK
ncbi:MAG: 50S ribosomal protein L17 [Proteobacteria bacterium]|nr:50S ribosomal protein L17 [Pseudomonadota bacterium]